MKKFILKQWYPSLYEDIEEGIEVEYKDGWIYYVNTRGNKTCVEFDPNEFIFTDFWEEGEQPLFVTEDGVEIFDDTTAIISVSIKHLTFSKWQYRFLSKPLDCENFKHFGVEANADKYIEENKPKSLFVTEDGVEVSDQEDVYYVTDKLEKINSFINWFTIEGMAKDTKVFFHESNADEYIWRHKPLFSYEDFIRWGNVPYQRVIEKLAKERSEQ